MSDQGESAGLASELFMEDSDRSQDDPNISRWHKQVAISTLIFALLAALGGLLSGITANQSQQERMEEILNLTVLEGDRVTVEILQAKHEILDSLGEAPDEGELLAISEFEAEIAKKQAEINREETVTTLAEQTHLVFAISVAMLAAGISLCGMAVVVSERWLWIVGLAVGGLGSIWILWGIGSMLL
jgi:hypothetical protein